MSNCLNFKDFKKFKNCLDLGIYYEAKKMNRKEKAEELEESANMSSYSTSKKSN